MAGTETGITEPVAAFSPCYGGPFLTLHPLRYAELLEQKLNDYDSSVYLVNTGWSDNGIFNFEGGCYAKAINLDKDKEPEIYNAIKHGTLLENVVYDLETKEVDFDDNAKSENSRICYPINFVENSLGSKGLKSAGPHPNSIIFLTCDAYGIMPPLARMTKKQAMYHTS